MTTFTKTTAYQVRCPHCDGDHIVKVGIQSGQQRYMCRKCRRKFRANGKALGKHMDAEVMGGAVQDYYQGKSYKQVAEALEKEYDLKTEPSKATVYEWVTEVTADALKAMKDHKPKTGGHWVADELVVDVGGQKAYLWNVMDAETRYILAAHLSARRDSTAARAVLRKAMKSADKPPKTITTDKWRPYIKPIKDIFPEAKHIQSEGMRANTNNNLSERLQGTFRDRLKTMRGLERIKSGQRFLDGWVLHYNLFKKHRSLHNKTPASKAKVDPPFKEWADVVKADAVEPVEVTLPTPRLPEKRDVPKAELTGTPKPTKPKKSSRESTGRSAPPLKLRLPKAKPPKAKREAARPRRRVGGQHPMQRRRRAIQRVQRGATLKRRGRTG